MSFSARNKIRKEGGAQPSAFENDVARAIFDLEVNNAELKADLREIHIVAAKEVDVGAKKSIVVFVPHKLLKVVHRAQARLVRELEKKFSGKQVVVVAQRRILTPETRNSHVARQRRPQSRSLTSVHNAILDDVLFPTEITGKRVRHRVDGSKTIRVILDKKDQGNVEGRLDTYTTVYKKLTGRDIVFEFPAE